MGQDTPNKNTGLKDNAMKYLILDGNNLLWACYHGSLRSRELDNIGIVRDKETNDQQVIVTFLQSVLNHQERLGTDCFVFCWDKGRSLRHNLLNTYKGAQPFAINKNFDKKAISRITTSLCEDILPACGFSNILFQEGYEADDLIAKFCKTIVKRNLIWNREKEPPSHGIIVSTDKDLYQLLDQDAISMWLHRTQKRYTEFDFRKEYQIDVPDWWRLKALAGCKSDNIKGILGIGETTALKYLLGIRSYSRNMQQKLILYAEETLAKNEPLVRLPFPGVELPAIKKDKLTKKKWIYATEKYGLGRLKLRIPIGAK